MSLKLICVAATLAVFPLASQAFADCSRPQEIELAKLATRALSDKIDDQQHGKQIKILDCDVRDGTVGATFVYHYVNNDGVQTVQGSVKAENGQVTSLNLGHGDGHVAMRDEDYNETNYGRFHYR